MTLQEVSASVPELGVAMIGSGLMAKSHTMGYRNVESVYGTTPLRPRFTVDRRTRPANFATDHAVIDRLFPERPRTPWKLGMRLTWPARPNRAR